MDENIKAIYAAFDGKLVGSFQMKISVCQVVAKLPDAMKEYITQKCWFVGSMEDAWAFAFTGNDLKDQHLVFLSDDLMAQDTEQIYYSIAHEIGHVVLGHRNSVFVKQSKEEVAKQEHEADVFARKYV